MIYFPFLKHKDNWPLVIQRYASLWKNGKWSETNYEARDTGVHAPVLYELGLWMKAQTILELGTRGGKSLRIWVEVAKKTGGHVWSMDKDDHDPDLGNENRPYYTFVYADDMVHKWYKPIDILYIDSSHEYQHTKDEMTKYWQFVSCPGLMIVADSDSHFPQKQAVNDWAEERRMGFISDTRNQGLDIFMKPPVMDKWRDSGGKHRWVRDEA